VKSKVVQRYVMLSLGVILSAYPVVAILRPNGLMTGGITGVSRILETVLENSVNISQNLLFNLIYYVLALLVLTLAFLFLGKEDGLKIIFMSIVYPLFLFLFTYMKLPAFLIRIPIQIGGETSGYIQDLLLPAIVYGVISGLGTGFIVRSGFTSGGSDTLAKIIYKRFLPFLSIGVILMFVDVIIILTSIFFFDVQITIYAIITKFISMRAVDLIVFGIGNRRVKIEILTKQRQLVIDYIINKVHRGVTLVDIEGGYSHEAGKQIICICTPRESLMVKNFIATIDRQAFVYIIPLTSIWGSGFKNIQNDDLSDD
jgi:uncharacterized membrane-anchored protein YitT (DUF2179 family)